MIYSEIIVQTTANMEYRVQFDSEVWTDRVDMLNAAWAEIAVGGVFLTDDEIMVRFNLANVSAVLVPSC
jgi:hypothetical protein